MTDSLATKQDLREMRGRVMAAIGAVSALVKIL
jgi:hypothetical protein